MSDNSSDYSAVSLFTVPPDEVLPFSVSIYYKGRFVIYRQAGQVFEVSKYNRFIYKRISKLYIANNEFQAYQDFVKSHEERGESKIKGHKDSDEKVIIRKTVKDFDLVTKELFGASDEEFSEATLKVIGVARNTVKDVCERPYLRIFDSIPESSSVVAHSMRVSLISVFLGYQLGFVNPSGLECLAAAGLLHDIGKTRVALSDDLEINEQNEEAIMRMHPALSVEVVKAVQGTPDEVLQIIAEHHERRDGSGYPAGLHGRQIHSLSKVFAIANCFDNIVGELQGTREMRHKMAAQKMEREMRSWFDPLLLPKALRLLATNG